VVVSPHLDDAALSLGAAMAFATRHGASVEVLTVFAGDPDSDVAAGGWDTRGGFGTEGEAARARREEDSAASELLGTRPTWLPFADEQYDRHGGEDEVWRAVAAAVADADSVLVPGFPLAHADHAWLSELLVRRGLPSGRVGVYAEQPYAYRVRKAQPRPTVSSTLASAAPIRWARLPARAVDRRTKREAIAAYRSQVGPLGLSPGFGSTLDRMLWRELVRGGEAVAWLNGRAA
jgi:LmbE family N-acetylglucosaminyl deacetylase